MKFCGLFYTDHPEYHHRYYHLRNL